MTERWVVRAGLPLAVSAVLVAVGLAVRLAGLPGAEDGQPPSRALRLLDVNRERNLPTAWSVLLLVGCAAAAVRLAVRLRTPAWALLALVPALMALDEAVQVHERADALGRLLVGDALHFAWVVPGALATAVVAAASLRLLRHAHPVLRARLALAAGLYLSGALVLEACSGVVLDAVGRGVLYALLNAAEEGLEMAGASLALAALLLAAERPPRSRTVRAGRPASLGR